MNTKQLAIKGDQNKFSVLLDGDTFGPKILFFGDEIRFLVPDSTRLTQMATVMEIPSYTSIIVKMNAGGIFAEGTIKKISRDRVLVVFPGFK